MAELRLRDVEVTYDTPERGLVLAVDGVDLTVPTGKVVGLVGESGCGKSTLARVASGLEGLAGGSVTFDGNPVHPLGWRRRRPGQRGLQIVFQDPNGSLNPRRRIGSQLADGLRANGHDADMAAISELLERVGLDAAAASRHPHQFSGGQLQRIAIARCLAARPRLLVADEPVTALDVSSQAQIVALLLSLVRRESMGLLFISHDLALVREIADEVAVMYLGRVVERGPVSEVLTTPKHPYTQALLDAIPNIQDPPKMPAELGGEVPDAADMPQGCGFRPRCGLAEGICHRRPTLAGEGNHVGACWVVQETGGLAVALQRRTHRTGAAVAPLSEEPLPRPDDEIPTRPQGSQP